jgi:hypothetical protein
MAVCNSIATKMAARFQRYGRNKHLISENIPVGSLIPRLRDLTKAPARRRV